MNQVILFVLCAGLIAATNAACLGRRSPCVYKSPSCANYDITSGVVTCPVSCNSCSGTSSLCSCGAPACSCFLDTEDVCASCAPQPSPICSCLGSLDLPACSCNCEAAKSFIYFPEVTYPVTALEMNPFFFATCYNL